MNKVVNVTTVRKGGEEANEWWITTRGLKVPVLPAGGLGTLVEEKKSLWEWWRISAQWKTSCHRLPLTFGTIDIKLHDAY